MVNQDIQDAVHDGILKRCPVRREVFYLEHQGRIEFVYHDHHDWSYHLDVDPDSEAVFGTCRFCGLAALQPDIMQTHHDPAMMITRLEALREATEIEEREREEMEGDASH